MSQRKATSAYTQRMNKVLDYIDWHLAEAIDLNTLAEQAHFSPFHFLGGLANI
jgi:AraC family transcriptional regulator